MIISLLLKLKGILEVFTSNIPLYIGLQPITLIGFISLLLFDFILDLINCYKLNQDICLKTNTKKLLFNIFFYIFLLFIIFSFTHQFGIIFTSMFNSIFVIFVLDNLINVFNSLGKLTKESAFIEITKFLKDKFNIFKNGNDQ